jgi:hypothetical protein
LWYKDKTIFDKTKLFFYFFLKEEMTLEMWDLVWRVVYIPPNKIHPVAVAVAISATKKGNISATPLSC